MFNRIMKEIVIIFLIDRVKMYILWVFFFVFLKYLRR